LLRKCSLAKKKWYRVYVYLALESVRWFIYVLPRSFAQKLAAGFGSIGYVLLRRHRKSAIENLKFAFGDEKSADELAHIARRNFVHLSQTAADMCRLPKWTRSGMPDLVHAPEGTQALDQAPAAGRGAIVLTGHLGNWELLGPCLRFLGYPGSLVGRRIYYEPYDRVLVSLRRSGLVETIYRDESPRQILEVLKRNHLIGMTTDQDIDSLDGIFIPFLGRDALTAVAPAKISLASGAPILPTFLVHDRGGYRLWFGQTEKKIKVKKLID
jgi:Kdo2-lipid IVA lauroyltransferase/acyltransferase